MEWLHANKERPDWRTCKFMHQMKQLVFPFVLFVLIHWEKIKAEYAALLPLQALNFKFTSQEMLQHNNLAELAFPYLAGKAEQWWVLHSYGWRYRAKWLLKPLNVYVVGRTQSNWEWQKISVMWCSHFWKQPIVFSQQANLTRGWGCHGWKWEDRWLQASHDICQLPL